MLSTPVQKILFPPAMGTDGLVKKDEFKKDQEKETVLVNKLSFALQTGYRMFDTAESYGTLRALISALGQCGMKRADVKIVYKIKPGRDPEALESALLEAIKIADGYLDVVMLHETNEQSIVLSALSVLQKLVNGKQAGCIGLSNTNHVELPGYLQTYPAIQYVQNEFTLSNYKEQAETLKLCQSQNIVYMGFGIIRTMPEDKRLTELAAKYGCKPAQVLLAWARAMGVLQIAGSSQAERIRENWLSLNVSLDKEAVDAITKLALESFPSAPVIQTGQTIPAYTPAELHPFYQAVQQLEKMSGKGSTPEEKKLIEDRKTAVLLRWNEFREQVEKGSDETLKGGLMKWKLNGKTLPQLMNDLQTDTGFCSAPKYASPILQLIDQFCQQVFNS